MICSGCHASNPENTSHCAQCGASLADQDDLKTILIRKPTPSGLSDADALTVGAGRPAWQAPGGSGSQARELDSSRVLEPGAELGSRYRIDSLLGKGGMGAVYKARDVELDRTIALKVIRADLASHPETMQRFKQELLLASRISHKHILRIHDLVEAGGMRFISMAYVDGEDLHSVLVREGRLPVDRVTRIACQLCAALDAAHTEGIIHRDLKPQNILIEKEGNAVISDFGLAKSLDAGAARMTQTGEMLGTPRYMSPEQVQGHQIDCRSDIYALGLIIYEMATGEAPFAGESLYQTMYLRTKERPKNPNLLNPELPEFLVRIIMRCLETDPGLRYQSAREILQDLETHHASARSMKIMLPWAGSRNWIWIGTLCLVMVVGIILAPRLRGLFSHEPAGRDAISAENTAPAKRTYVAVVPFRVLGDSASLGYISEGLGEAISARLFQLKEVYVPAFADAEKAAAKGDLDKVARELGVKLIVHGTITQAGNKIAVILNLQDADTGQRLWTKEFSGLTQDLLTLQDAIYGALVSALRLNPDSDERARTATHYTESIQAYELYLKGRNALRGQQEVRNVKAAITCFEGALKLDAGFALAYVGLSDANLLMYRATKDNAWAQKAVSAGEQAQRLNDQLPEVCFSLGSVYNATGKTAEAIAILNRALQLAPNSDEGYRRLGATLVRTGRRAEAIQAYQKAIEINPYYWLNFSVLGAAYFKMGNFDEALKAYRKIIELEPSNVFGPLNVGAVLFSQGKYEECIPAFQKALEIQPSWEIYSNLGTAYFYLKRPAESVAAFERALQLNPNQEVAVGNLADAYRLAGQKEKASATYDKAIALAFKELEVNPRNADSMASLALYYAKKGTTNRALDFIRRARAIDENNVEYIYSEAIVRTLAGQPREALKSLRVAFEKGYAVSYALGNPEFDTLENLPEFKELVADFTRSGGRQK
jgi:eukaryotic-like serine/threonine-protein kinase